DGGVLNNFPVDVMAAVREGPVLGMDVMGRRSMRGHGPPPVPSLLETLSRVTVLGSWDRARRNRELAEWIVTPELEGVGMLDFRRLPELVERGRAAGRGLLAAHPELVAAHGRPPR